MIRENLQQRLDREKAEAKPIDPLTIVDDEFMNNREIAAKFAISRDAVEVAQNNGELPYVVFGNPRRGRRVSPKRAILAWAASRLVRR